jgi:GGDEF domain-containing protein
MHYKEFASKIKTKYPDYSDMDDRTLAERMVAKYPEYSDITFDDPLPENKMDAIPYLQDIAPKVSSFRASPIPMNKELGYSFGEEKNMPVTTGSEATKTATQRARPAPLPGTPYNEMNQVKSDVPKSGFDSFLAGTANVAGGILGEMTKAKTRTLDTNNPEEVAKYDRGEAIRRRGIDSKDPQFLRTLTPQEKDDYDFSRTVTIARQPVTGLPGTKEQVATARVNELQADKKSQELTKGIFSTADQLASLEEQSNALREQILDRNIYNDKYSEAWNSGDIGLSIDLLGAQAAARGDKQSAEIVKTLKHDFENRYAENVPTERLRNEFTGAIQKLKIYTDLKTDYDEAVRKLPQVQSLQQSIEQQVNVLPEVQSLIASYQDKATEDMTPAQITALSNDLTRAIEQLPQVQALYNTMNAQITSLDEVKQLHASFMDTVNSSPEIKVLSNKLNKDIEKLNPKNANWFTKLTTSTVEMLPPLMKGGALAAIPVVGGAAAGTMWAAQGAGSTFNNLVSDGVDPQDARKAAAVVGPIYAAIEMIQLGQLTRVPALKNALEKGFTSALKQLGKEYGYDLLKEVNEEGLQGVVQTVGEETTKGKSPEEVAKLAVKSYVDNVKQSIGPMAIIGAPAKIGSGVKAAADQKAEKIKGDIAADTQIIPSPDATIEKPETPSPEVKRDKVLADFGIKDEEFWESEKRDEVFAQLTPEEQNRLFKLEEKDNQTESTKKAIADFDKMTDDEKQTALVSEEDAPLDETTRAILEHNRSAEIQKEMLSVNTEPTDRQKDAGNYRKGHIKRDGLDISIENPAGSTRNGVDGDGRAWSQQINHDYGYIKGTVGKDKDHLDVFIKPDSDRQEGGNVYIVNQVDPKTGKFDEHKALLGFQNENEAREAYLSNYEPGWKGLKSIVEMPMDTFKQWIKTDATKKEAQPLPARTVTQKGMSDENKSTGQETETLLTTEAPDLRVDPAYRKKVSEMTPEEMKNALLSDDLTGIANRRAYDESDKLPIQGIADIDSLKTVNDTYGYQAGDALIKAVAHSLKQAGLSTYRIGGDEIRYQETDEKTVEDKLKKAYNILSGYTFQLEDADGKKYQWKGAGFSYGHSQYDGKDLEGAQKLANDKLHTDKSRREALGIRAPRGERIRGLVEQPSNQGQVQSENNGNSTGRNDFVTPTSSPVLFKPKINIPTAVKILNSRNVHDKASDLAADLLDAIAAKDPETLEEILTVKGDSRAVRGVFQAATGLSIPSDIPSARVVIQKFVGDELYRDFTREKIKRRLAPKVDKESEKSYTTKEATTDEVPDEQSENKVQHARGREDVSGRENSLPDNNAKTGISSNTATSQKSSSGNTSEKVITARPASSRTPARPLMRLGPGKYSIKYNQEKFLHHLQVEVYNALSQGWRNKGIDYKGSYPGWLNDFNILTDAKVPSSMKKGELSPKGKSYLQTIVDAYTNEDNARQLKDEYGLDAPEHIDDVRNWLERSKGKKEFESYHKQYDKDHTKMVNDGNTPEFFAAQDAFMKDPSLLTEEQKTILEEVWQINIDDAIKQELDERGSDVKFYHEPDIEIKLNNVLKQSSGVENAVNVVSIPATEEHATADKIAQAFGVNVVWFKQGAAFRERMGGIGGIFLINNKDLQNTIFINEKTKSPVLNTIGHELLHRMKQKHPDLYHYLKDAFMSEASEDYFTDLAAYMNAFGYNQDNAQEELIAEFTGQEFANRRFWDKLYNESPDAFKAAMKILHDLIAKVIRVLRNDSENPLLNDAEKIRNVLIQVTREYQKREQKINDTIIFDKEFNAKFARFLDKNQTDLFEPTQMDLFSLDNIKSNDRTKSDTTVKSSSPSTKAELSEQTDLFNSEPQITKQEIVDFGEKIGGARKDYYTKLNDAESFDIASNPLSKVWPEPDYSKLVESGIDPYIVAFVHAARDEVPAKPAKSWKLRTYVDQVQTLRDLSKRLLNGDITTDTLKALLSTNFKNDGFIGRIDLYNQLGHNTSFKGLSFALHHYSYYRGENDVSKWIVESSSAASSVFSNMPSDIVAGDTKEEAIDKLKKIISDKLEAPIEKKTKFEIYSYRKEPNVYHIGKKTSFGYVDLFSFPNSKEAKIFLLENYNQVRERFEQFKKIGNERRAENLPRIGTDYRKGKNVTPEMFNDAFGFRGVEFGNWVEQDKRQTDLNQAYDALMDLAIILNIPSRGISLNGKLGLAFGARGRGGARPAKAHYESDKVVINLTKKNGAGSLAHEWMHALDAYFSSGKNSDSDMATMSNQVQIASVADRFRNDSNMRDEMVQAFGNLVKTIKKTQLPKRSQELDMRRSTPYWSLMAEMTARSFENYIIQRLSVLKMSNDYLANITSAKEWAQDMLDSLLAGKKSEDSYPYLTEDEIGDVVKAFDNLFKTIKVETQQNGNVVLYQREFEQGDLFAGTAFEDTRSKTQKLIDAELQRREQDRKARQKNNIFEGTPLFDKNEQEARATQQETLPLFQREDLIKDIVRFSKNVDSFVAGEHLTTKHFAVMSKTPDVYLRYGAKKHPIVISTKVLTKIIEGKYDRVGLPLKTIKQLPVGIVQPIAIFKSDTEENALVIAIDLKNHNNDNVVIVLHLDQNQRINSIKSVYGKDRKQWYQEQTKKGNLLFVDKKRAFLLGILHEDRLHTPKSAGQERPQKEERASLLDVLHVDGLHTPQTAGQEKISPTLNISKKDEDVNGIRFQREKSPLAPFEKLQEASQLVEDRLRKTQQYQQEINRLRYQLRSIPEDALDKRALIEVKIDKATDKRTDEIRQGIYEYAAKIGLRGVPYNKVDLLLKNAKTIKALQRALNTMDEVYDRTRIAELRKDVYDTIWKKMKKLNRLQNAKVPSNVDLEANRALRDYLDKLMFKTDNVDKERLQKLLTWLQRDAAGNLADKEMEEVPKSLLDWLNDMSLPIPSIAEEATKGLFSKSIDSMTANELQDVLNEIKSIEETGKSRRAIESAKRAAEEIEAVGAMSSEIIRKRNPTREKPIRGETLEERAKKSRTLWNTIKQLPWQARDIDRIIIALTGKTSGTALEKYILKPMAAANILYKKGMKAVDSFVKKTYDKLSIPELRKPWIEIAINQAQPDGETIRHTRMITQEEGMFIYANSKNEAQAEHLYATINHTDRSDAIRVVNEVVSKLPEDLKAAVEAQWEYFDKVQWSRMNDVFSRAHNIDMGHEQYYMPATNLDRGGDGINIDADLMMRAAKQASSDIGSTKNRIVMGPDPRKPTDENQGPVAVKAAPYLDMLYFTAIVPAMRQAEHYIAFYEPVFLTNRYMGKSEFLNALDAHDPAVAPVLMDWLKAMAYGKWSYGQGHEFFDAIIRYLRGAAGRYQILGRVTSLLLQASSAPRGFITIHPKYVVSSLATIIKNPVEFFNVVNNKSAEIEGRMKDWDQTISEWAESEEGKKLMGKWNPIDKTGELLGNIIGGYDKFWASYIWYAKYSESLDKQMGEEDAIYEADKVVRKTQSGGGILASNRLQRGGDLYRAFTQFLSDAVKAYNLLDETVMAWKTLPASQKAAYIILGLMLPAFMTHLVRSGGDPTKDPLNYAKELITQVTGAIPFVGQLVDFATIYGINKFKEKVLGLQVDKFSLSFAGDVDAPALSMVGDITDEITAADKAKTPDKIAYHLFNAVALATGLPGGGQVKRTWGGLEETRKTGDIRNLILPKSAVQKPKHTMINVLHKSSRTWNEERAFLKFYDELSLDAKSKFIERTMAELQLKSPDDVKDKIKDIEMSYSMRGQKFDTKLRSLERKLGDGEITQQEYDEKKQEIERDRKKYNESLRK